MSTGRPKGQKNRTPEEREQAEALRQKAIEDRKALLKESPRGKLGQALEILNAAGTDGIQPQRLVREMGVSLDHARMILSELASRGLVSKKPVTYYRAALS